MTIKQILHEVAHGIKTNQEREYFIIHVARYRVILEKIQQLFSDVALRQAQGQNSQKNNDRLRILDVGCYPYHLPRALELMGHEVHGISSTHEPIRHKNVKVLNIETDRFPWKDNTFDLVIFTEVLEHLPQSPLLALKEMYRVTRPGGHLLVTTPNIARSINRAKLLIGKSITYPVEDLLENEGKGSTIYMRHNREYTMGELKEIVEGGPASQRMSAGTAGRSWKVEKAEYFISYTPFRERVVPDPWWLWLGKFANYLLMLAFPSLRDTLLVTGRK